MSTPYSYTEVPPAQLRLAEWKDRFFAWIIDIIIVLIVIHILYSISGSPGYDLKSFPLRSLAFFLYWTFFETVKGQSIGKMVLKLRTVEFSGRINRQTAGKTVGVKSAAIQSFGKSFLLPIDLVLGWIFTNKYRQRIFNRLSNTVVVKLER
jgi:uncharacterized RDD family membrane protein YckC